MPSWRSAPTDAGIGTAVATTGSESPRKEQADHSMSEKAPQTVRSSRADRHLQAAARYLRNGRREDAIAEARRAGEIATEAGDEHSLAMAENMIAEIEWERGHWGLASRLFGAAREHAEESDESLLLLIESNDAAVWADLGQDDLVRDSLRAALPRLELVDDHPAAGRILRNLARALEADEPSTAADGLLSRALDLAKRESDYREGARLAVQRARLALTHGDALRADAHMSSVAVLVERVEDEAVRADAACLEGEAHRIGGRLETAERCLLQAIELARGADAGGVIAHAARILAEVLLEQGRSGEAIEALDAAHRQFLAMEAGGRAAEAARRATDIRARSHPGR